MDYKVELRDSGDGRTKKIYLVNGKKERQIGSYSSNNPGFRLRHDSSIRVLGGDTKKGGFVPLSPDKVFRKSLEVKTARLFWKFFRSGSELCTIDVEKDEII